MQMSRNHFLRHFGESRKSSSIQKKIQLEGEERLDSKALRSELSPIQRNLSTMHKESPLQTVL
jgi:hypothetical protein